mgnify:CR=1 FL=1
MARGTTRGTRLVLWIGGAAAAAIAVFLIAALVRWNGEGPEAACAASGGVWNFEARICEPDHGAGGTEH